MPLSKKIMIIMYDTCFEKNILLRPETMFYRLIDTTANYTSKISYYDIKYNKLPVEIIHILTDPYITKICWESKTTSAITNTLLSEAGVDCHPSFISIQKILSDNGLPYNSLNSAAKRFNIHSNCRSDVKNKDKLRKRFKCFFALVKKLLYIDKLGLFRGLKFK